MVLTPDRERGFTADIGRFDRDVTVWGGGGFWVVGDALVGIEHMTQTIRGRCETEGSAHAIPNTVSRLRGDHHASLQ